MTVHRWAELTRAQLGTLLPDALVVLAVGATEQHGPHLPTGTDAMVVDAVVVAAAEVADAAPGPGRDLVLAPTLPFGASDHHFPFGATLSLRTETMTEVLLDLARSVHVAGGRQLLVVNGHGGNRGPCHSAAQRAATAYELQVAYVDYWELLLHDGAAVHAAVHAAVDPGLDPGVDPAVGAQAGGGPPIPGHAGAFESSLVAHLHPALVRDPPDRAVPPAGGPGLPAVTVHEQAAWARIDGFTDRPAALDATAGKRWFDACVAALAARITTLAAR